MFLATLPPAKLVLLGVRSLIAIYQLFPKAGLVTISMDNSKSLMPALPPFPPTFYPFTQRCQINFSKVYIYSPA